MTPDELWCLLATTTPEGPQHFLDQVGPDAPRTLDSLLLLLEAMPLNLRESALVDLVLHCVRGTVFAELPAVRLVQ